MTHRKPRRAGARWLEGAPEYVVDVLDNRGKTLDRYTVIFGGSLLIDEGPDSLCLYLGISNDPCSPLGFSQWGELTLSDQAAFRYRSGRDRIRWLDLPDHIRSHITARATE